MKKDQKVINNNNVCIYQYKNILYNTCTGKVIGNNLETFSNQKCLIVNMNKESEGDVNMKRTYEKPFAEKIEFNYENTVVASNGGGKGDKGHGVSQTDKGCNRVPGHDNADE